MKCYSNGKTRLHLALLSTGINLNFKVKRTRQHSGAVYSKKVLNPVWCRSMWSLHVLSVSLRKLQLLLTVQMCRLTVDSKLAVGVNVRMSGCLSRYVSPAED